MFGNNSANVSCGKIRRTKGTEIFKLPLKKLHSAWLKKWLNEITKTKIVDAHFQSKIENDTAHTCDHHFAEEDIDIHNYFNYILLHEFEPI